VTTKHEAAPRNLFSRSELEKTNTSGLPRTRSVFDDREFKEIKTLAIESQDSVNEKVRVVIDSPERVDREKSAEKHMFKTYNEQCLLELRTRSTMSEKGQRRMMRAAVP
jgi:hypothetical protein